MLELGANHPGEIASLAGLCRPTVGVITQIGDAHLAGFGNRRNVAREKAELLAALPPDGQAVLGRRPLAPRRRGRLPGEHHVDRRRQPMRRAGGGHQQRGRPAEFLGR